MKLLRSSFVAAALAAVALSASAQTTTPTPGPRPALGSEIRAIIDANRDAIKALAVERKGLLDKLKAATTDAERAAIRTQLQALMQATKDEQRALAKSIRDAIKARRDRANGGG